MLTFLVRGLNAIHIVLVRIAEILIVAMVLVIFTNVVLRYVFNSGLPWSEEVALLMVVWFVFLSFGLGVKQRLHITINVLPRQKMHPRLNRALDVLAEIVMILVGLAMIVWGSVLVRFTMRSVMPATGWPAGLLYLVLPFSGLSVIIEALLHLLRIDGKDEAVDKFLLGEGSASEVFGDHHA